MGAGTARPFVLPLSGVDSGTSRPAPISPPLSTVNHQPASSLHPTVRQTRALRLAGWPVRQISRAYVIPSNRAPCGRPAFAPSQPRHRSLAGSPGIATGGLDCRDQRGQQRQSPGPERPADGPAVVQQDQLHARAVRPGPGGRAAGSSAVLGPGAGESRHYGLHGASSFIATCPFSLAQQCL